MVKFWIITVHQGVILCAYLLWPNSKTCEGLIHFLSSTAVHQQEVKQDKQRGQSLSTICFCIQGVSALKVFATILVCKIEALCHFKI